MTQPTGPLGSQSSTPPTMLDVALATARDGYRVHPLVPRGKVPLLGGWPERATRDEATIRAWWGDDPQANVGIACGPGGWTNPDTGQAHNLVVVDPDGEAGVAAFLRMCRERGGPPGPALLRATRVVDTPSGGLHVYVLVPDDLRVTNRASGLPDGVDVRGAGGNLVAAGSRAMAKGTDVLRPYAVRTSHPPTPAPGWLVEVLTRTTGRTGPKVTGLPHVAPADCTTPAEVIARDLQRHVHRVRDSEPPGPGNGWSGNRNQSLNDSVYRLTRMHCGGELTEVMLERLVQRLGRIALEKGLPRRRVRATIQSAMRGGFRHGPEPRTRIEFVP